MAVGDIKDERAVVLTLVSGEAIAKGQVVAQAADMDYEVSAADDTGKFAVAIEAAAADETEFRAVVYGPVEVVADDPIQAGNLCEAGTVAGSVAVAAHGAVGEIVGMAMEDIADGVAGTVWIGIGA